MVSPPVKPGHFTVSSYAEMLSRIAIGTFVVSLVCTSLLSANVPAIDQFLSRIGVEVEVGSVELSLGIVLPALLLAFASRIFKLHDRISDVLRIRAEFDVNHILKPLALGSGATVPVDKLTRMRTQRSELMKRTFYKYASSDPKKTIIDSHNVQMALDQWGYYWVLAEANAVAILATFLLFVFGQPGWAVAILAVVLVVVAVMRPIKSSCSKYALTEVDEILDDDRRRESVAAVFNAL